MRMMKAWIGAAVLAGLAASACLSGCASLRGEEAARYRTIRENASNEAFQYLVEYPAFPGLPVPTELARGIAQRAVADFLAQSRENWQAWRDTATEADLASGRPPHELRISWHAEQVDAEAISLYLEIYSFTGGAHGDLQIKSVNYDPRAQRLLELPEVLRNRGEDWLERLSAAARGELKKRLDPKGELDLASWIDEGAGPDPANYATFVFDEDEVTIIFQKYQVAPGASGEQSVVLPRDLGELP